MIQEDHKENLYTIKVSLEDKNMFTLESILELKDDKYTSFTIYLQHTYCIENLYFWQDAQEYKLHPTLDKYQYMIQKYIITDSPYEINIPCDMRENLLANFTPQCFDEAAETILELIRTNSFIPWYYTIYSHHQEISPKHRNSFLSPSISFPDKWQLRNQFNISRPSFSSLRAPSTFSTSTVSSYRSVTNKLSHLLQHNTLVLKFKTKFNNKELANNRFSWLAKK